MSCRQNSVSDSPGERIVKMKVNVQFEAQLQRAAGVADATAEIPTNGTVMTVLQQIAVSRPEELGRRLFSEDGELLASLLLFVNEQPVPTNDAANRQLSDGDRLLLLPPISGG